MRSSRTIPSSSVGLCLVSLYCRLTPAVLGASGDLAKKKVCPSTLLQYLDISLLLFRLFLLSSVFIARDFCLVT